MNPVRLDGSPPFDPYALSAAEVKTLLLPSAPMLPELEEVRQDLPALRRSQQAESVLAASAAALRGDDAVPALSYSARRAFRMTGDRLAYQTPYFQRRSRLTAAALRLFLGEVTRKPVVEDFLWAICEESDWVVPAHEGVLIDIMAAETGYQLAETLMLLGEGLDGEVRARVRAEVERRILGPYLRHHAMHWWYRVDHNWNSVCNSAVGATFLWLEQEPDRLAQALAFALSGLREYVAHGFERDGTCSEGIGYWNYGLMNFVPFAEMLRGRTGGAIDLLGGDHPLGRERIAAIASFPGTIHLSGECYASFADCDQRVNLATGVMLRVATRSGDPTLPGLICPPDPDGERWRLPMELRTMLWWNGGRAQPEVRGAAWLQDGGLARLVSTAGDSRVVLVVRASHNGANHSHNDVGSFMLHVGGESLLTDPGRGLYTRQYFSPTRGDNVFVSSYGHSVPTIGGTLQREGRDYAGQILGVEPRQDGGVVALEFGRAYPRPELASARRILRLQGPDLVLDDAFEFTGSRLEVEEAFVTWADVRLEGATAIIAGRDHTAQLTIETPAGARWRVEELMEASRANAKPEILKRLTFLIPAGAHSACRVVMQVLNGTRVTR